MMHSPVSPGKNVFLNGGNATSESNNSTSIDLAQSSLVPQSQHPTNDRISNSGNQPAHGPASSTSTPVTTAPESVGRRTTDKMSVGTDRQEGNDESGVQKPGSSDGRLPPRSTVASTSNLSQPVTSTSAKVGPATTGGFVPLQLTSPTAGADPGTKKEMAEITVQALKTPTELPRGSESSKTKESKKATTLQSPSLQPPSNEIESDRTDTKSNNQDQTSDMAASKSNTGTNSTSATPSKQSNLAPYIEDSDSEDEEVQELLSQKREQIRRDIIAFQKSKEIELAVFEKRLRDDQMRKRRRKAALANGYPVTSGSPRSFYSLSTKQAIGTLPGYLPLTAAPNGNAPNKPSGLRKEVESKGNEKADALTSVKEAPRPTESSKSPSGPSSPAPEAKPEITVKSPAESPSNKSDVGNANPASPIAITSTTLQPPQTPPAAAPKLSSSALRALEGPDKPSTPLPSSLKSTSSWTSGSGKDSRRSSVADAKSRKNKRVIFQLQEDGDWFRVKPSGEQVPMDPDLKEQLRTQALWEDDDFDSESESDFIMMASSSKRSVNAAPAPPSTSLYSETNATEAEQKAPSKPNKGPEDPDWISSKPVIPEPAPISSAKSTISEDSLDDDVFDLDEEVPLSFSAAPSAPEFTSGSLEESVMSLGLPLAPPPPPPPGGSGINVPATFGRGSSTFADTMAYIQAYQQAGYSRGSSVSGSYLSSSFPRNSYAGSSNSWHDPSIPPRPSSSHGSSSTLQSTPIAVGARRPSGNWDLVTAPTLETLSTSSSNAIPIPNGSVPLSGSLPAGSGFRRRSVTKYDIPDEEIKDGSASSSVTSKPDMTTPPLVLSPPKSIATTSTTTATATAINPKPNASNASSTRTSIEKEAKSSPYGTSAPISIPLRNAPVVPSIEEPLVAPEQVKDEITKEVVSGRPSPTSNATEKSNQPTTAKARDEAQKKPVISPAPVEKVLEATTEALNKNSLPSTMSSRPKKEKGSRSGSSTPKTGSYTKKSPSSRTKRTEPPVKPEASHATVIQTFPTHIGDKSRVSDAAQAVSSPGWNAYSSTALLSSSLPKSASGISTSSFGTNPITALPGVKSYSPTAPSIASSSNSPRKGPKTLSSVPRYSSLVAEQAAAAVEAKGLSIASVVGGVDGRTGLDASVVNRNSLIFTDIGPESLKESFANINPNSLSFSMRLALEEEEATKEAMTAGTKRG